MREFEVTIAGRTRPLKFTSKDAVTLQKRFGRSPAYLINSACLGFELGKVGADNKPIRNVNLFDYEVQVALLTTALERGGSRPVLDEDDVMEAIDAHLAESEKNSLADLLAPAIKCALYSGAVMQKRIDLDAIREADADAGKASKPAEPPAAIKPAEGI
jgi:hypothetical protein